MIYDLGKDVRGVQHVSEGDSSQGETASLGLLKKRIRHYKCSYNVLTPASIKIDSSTENIPNRLSGSPKCE